MRVVVFILLFIGIHAFSQSDTIFVSYSDSVKDFFKVSVSKALDQGVISSDLKVNQLATITFKGKSHPAQIRLKGDWTDHVSKDSWSLRVKLEEGNIYQVRKFSLQAPETRGGEKEKIFHDILKEEGILTTDYRFVTLMVNGESWGNYAFEEHFDELLLENNHRSNAPILKFNEKGFWEVQMLLSDVEDKYNYELQIFEAAKISAFQKKKLKKDSTQLANWQNAEAILYNWRKGKLDFDKIDINRFAKYFALCDVFTMYHGLQWHNQRFYYRPQDGKLEPVAYDCYFSDNSLIGKSNLGFFDEHYQTVYFNEQWFNYQLFTNLQFRKQYAFYLSQYAQPDYFEEIKEIKENWTGFTSRCNELGQFDMSQQKVPVYYSYEFWKIDHPDEVRKYKQPYKKDVLPHVYLRAELLDSLRVTNFYLYPITILGLDTNDSILTHNEQVITSKSTMVLPYKGFYSYVYSVADKRDTIRSKIDRIKSLEEKSMKNFSRFLMNGGNVVSEDMVVPKDGNVSIENLNIQFENGARIYCYGSLKAVNCTFEAIDSLGGGITVVENKLVLQGIKVQNFTFDTIFNDSPLKVWNSKVEMKNVTVRNIVAEDAVNIVGCSIELDSVFVSNCSGDGLDIDFGVGVISNCRVINAKGDGIDFSGSKIKVKETFVSNSGDKGISVGERSKVVFDFVEVTFCPTAAAVKDGSELIIRSFSTSECAVDINSFRKKDFYNRGGKINVIPQIKYKIIEDQYSK